MQKTILITGCSSGIGFDAAHGLRAAGWRVFASCRAETDCARLRDLGFDSPRIDLADEASIDSGLAEVLAATGGTLDALYNNGAFACPGLVEDLPRDALRAIFETNLFGTHDLTRRVIPVMRKQGHGRIINCSSVLGLVGYQWRGAYVSTKFALEGLSDVLRLEMGPAGIHVILVEPGPITSDIRRKAIPHFERWIDWKNAARSHHYEKLKTRLYAESGPDKFELPASAVTKVILKALNAKKPRPRYYVTIPTHAMGFARRILPSAWLDAVIRRG